MKFTSLASSSKGNAYLVEADGIRPLLIEAGIPIKQLAAKMYSRGVPFASLAGCLISHEHGDHSKAVSALLKAAVDCHMSTGTAVALDVITHHRTHLMAPGLEQYQIYNWKVVAFHLKHDAAEPFGYLIAHNGEVLLFCPDTAYIKNRFADVNIIAIECNHVSEVLARNIQSGLPTVVGRRVRRNHMSLETVIKMLKANDLSKCREIHLLHLSDGNSDEQRMIKEVQEATGIPTYAAQ